MLARTPAAAVAGLLFVLGPAGHLPATATGTARHAPTAGQVSPGRTATGRDAVTGRTLSGPAVPSPGGSSVLQDVACTSARNCWAVGSYETKTAQLNEALHWNGTSWTKVGTPDHGTGPGDHSSLSAVACTSARNCWAVGSYDSGAGQLNQALQWNGSSWVRIATPDPGLAGSGLRALNGVSCVSRADCWAVGVHISDRGISRNAVLQWNGASWLAVSAPDPGDDFFDGLMHAWEESWPKPRVIVLSFPHNPTTACVDLSFMERLVAFAREHEIVLVHDFAYADLGFDGYDPPSILQVPGAKDVAVELYTLTKSFSMAGWRVGFLVGNREIVQALTKLKTYLDYGTFQPIQIAAIVAMNEAPDYPKWVNETYQARRDALCDGLNRIGWRLTPPKGTMFVWAPIPEPYREMGSLEFSSFLVSEAEVATSPGVGFGPGGDGHVRFALIENEQRVGQAVRNLRRTLTKLQ